MNNDTVFSGQAGNWVLCGQLRNYLWMAFRHVIFLCSTCKILQAR